jgi:predicted metal-dependent hydrolase
MPGSHHPEKSVHVKNNSSIFCQNGIKLISKYDGRMYEVIKHNTQEQAVELLAHIRNRIVMLSNLILKDKYLNKFDISFFQKQINKIEIAENTQCQSGLTSYTVDKGKKMVLCLRSNATKELHDLNLIFYVVIHELAHILCPDYGHTQQFVDIFKHMLFVAMANKLYFKIDFVSDQIEYCGMIIHDNLI